VRNGIESADLNAPNYPPLVRSPKFRPITNWIWTTHVPIASYGYRLTQSNYRGLIRFGRPLHVRRVTWELRRPGIIFHAASQAYRLARPASRRIRGSWFKAPRMMSPRCLNTEAPNLERS